MGSIISFEDLPKDRNGNLWIEIRNDCRLSLGELYALRMSFVLLDKIKSCLFLLFPIPFDRPLAFPWIRSIPAFFFGYGSFGGTCRYVLFGCFVYIATF